MRTIDRGGGGRHFTVSAGQTLTVELLRLHSGAVSTSVQLTIHGLRGALRT